MKTTLRKIFAKTISGEWGEDDIDGKGVNVIRTANFTNDGKIDYSNIVKRSILKKTIENGEEIYVEDTEKINQKSLRDGDIIIEKSGGGVGSPVGRVVFFKNPDNNIYLANNFTQILRPNENIVYSRYAFYYLRYLYQKGTVLKYQNQTTGIFNLKLERYLQEEITLPDLDSQYSLVTQLDTIQNLIDLRDLSIAACEELKKSIFTRLFVNNPERSAWEYKELSHYVKSKKYGIASALNSDSGYPIIRMNNITYQGTLDLSNLKYIYLSDEEFANYELKKRDILFNRTNSIELVGKCAVWEDLSGYVYAGYLFVIKLKENLLNPYFLTAYLNSDLGKTILKNKAKVSGNMANFSASLLIKQKILVPPVAIQESFEEKIANVNDQINSLNLSRSLLQNMFQSGLQLAFKSNTAIDEQAIFKDLVKRFSVKDFRNDKNRLQYLIDLFKSNEFNTLQDYSDAKEKLFDLISTDAISQVFDNEKITLLAK